MRNIFTAIIILLLSSLTPVSAQTVLFQDDELIQAAKLGDYEKIRSALTKGDNPDTANSQGVTPFIIAAKGEYIDIMELLLENRASINWQDSLGNTALFYAVDKTAYETVAFLLENGANPNVQNDSGVAVLMTSAITGDQNIIRLLLDKNPDLTLKDYTGRSVLDYARDSRNRNVEEMLRRAGASE